MTRCTVARVSPPDHEMPGTVGLVVIGNGSISITIKPIAGRSEGVRSAVGNSSPTPRLVLLPLSLVAASSAAADTVQTLFLYGVYCF
jgi:hypothetical protein